MFLGISANYLPLYFVYHVLTQYSFPVTLGVFFFISICQRSAIHTNLLYICEHRNYEIKFYVNKRMCTFTVKTSEVTLERKHEKCINSILLKDRPLMIWGAEEIETKISKAFLWEENEFQRPFSRKKFKKAFVRKK